MVATVLLVLSIVALLAATFGATTLVGVNTQPLGLALAAAAWLALRVNMP